MLVTFIAGFAVGIIFGAAAMFWVLFDTSNSRP